MHIQTSSTSMPPPAVPTVTFQSRCKQIEINQIPHLTGYSCTPLALFLKPRTLRLNLRLRELTERRRRFLERALARARSGLASRTEPVSLCVLSDETRRRHVEGSRSRDMFDTPMQQGHTGTWVASLYHIGSGQGRSSSMKMGTLVSRRLDRHCVLVSP